MKALDERRQLRDGVRVQRVVDKVAASFGANDARLAKHAEMMRHGRLGDMRVNVEVTRAGVLAQ